MAYSSSSNSNSAPLYGLTQPSAHLSPSGSHSASLFDDMLDSSLVASDMTRQSSSTFAPSSVFSPDTSLIEDFAPSTTNGAFYVQNDVMGNDGSSNLPVLEPNNGHDGSAFTNTPNGNANGNNAYSQLQQPTQVAAFGQQQANWPFSPTSAFSPTDGDQFSPTDFESLHPAPFMAPPVGATDPPHSAAAFDGLPANPTTFTPVQSMVNQQPPSGHVRQVAVPMQHARKDWMSVAAQEADPRPLPKRMRPNTPPRAFSPHHHHHQRRDGIRKKNARFEIPAERSLFNIDELISQSTNDDEVKELKQQKRLLRNRQAALDSRQRKKKHTEELEEEKKAFTERLASLEEELHNMRLEADHWHRQHLESQRVIDMLHWEKEDLVRTHTNETGELRRKVSILSEKVGSTAMSAAASSTGFSDLASDYDGLKLGAQSWDNPIFASEFGNMDAAAPAPAVIPVDAGALSVEQPLHQQRQQPRQAPMVQPNNLSFTTVKEDDSQQEKPVASGLLLMLLLCGAFVASKSAGSSPPTIPRMSDEVRAASANVLDSIFRDAGVAPSPSDGDAGTMTVASQRPHPSGKGMIVHGIPTPSDPVAPLHMGGAWSDIGMNGGGGSNGLGASSLGQLQVDLTSLTGNQEAEQAFGMTASQYNSVTDAGFVYEYNGLSSPDADADADADAHRESDGQATPMTSPSGGFGTDGSSTGFVGKGAGQKRSLMETLAAMREQAPGRTAAEVYTRSLLWERIPADVVMEFKRLVETSTGVAAPVNMNGQTSMVKTQS